MTGYQAGPCPKRKLIERRLMHAEGAPSVPPRCLSELWQQPNPARNWPRSGIDVCRPPGAVGRRGELVRQRFRYKCPCPRAALEIPLCQELRISIEDREARNPDFGGESPAGRQLLSRPQIAAKDRSPVAVIDLPVEGSGAVPVNGDDGQHSSGNVSHRPIIVAMPEPSQVAMVINHSSRQHG